MARWIFAGAAIGAIYTIFKEPPQSLDVRYAGYLLGGSVAGAFMFGLGRLIYSMAARIGK